MSDTFFNKQPTISDDENMVYTMGGLDGLPTDAPATPTVPTTQVEQPEAPSYLSRIMPDINFGDFIGSAGQLAQLFPGTQVKPSYQPGLTDLTFTRGYYGPQEDVMPSGFGTESAGTLFWSPQRYQMPAPTFQTQQPREQDDEERQRRENEAILQTALGMDWSGAYNDYLNRLEAENQDINISNVFTPTNVNYQTQSQWQQQSQGGGQTQRQDQDDSDSTDYSLDDILSNLPTSSVVSTLIGGNGNDTISKTVDTVKGGKVNDSINLDDQTIDFDIGFRDEDTVDGGSTVTTIIGGDGNDTIDGGDGNTTIIGGNGNDTVTKTLTDSQKTVSKIYDSLFERTADDEGRDYWASKLDAGTPIDELLRQIAGSATEADKGRISQGEVSQVLGELRTTEAQRAANEQTVKDAYERLLNRSDIDQEGLDYWTTQLNLGKTSTELLRDMVSGAQGTDAQTAVNTNVVDNLYKELLGRDADPAGLEYYRSQLAAGASPDEVAQNIISGARAGEEASKISQEEIDRYFKQPETSTPTQNTVDSLVNSLNTQSLEALYSSSQEGQQTVSEIKDLARQWTAGMILTPGMTPEQFRDGFIKELSASRPDLFTKMVGDNIANQYTMEYYSGEGGTTSTGTDVRGLADEIVKRANDPDYVKAAIQLASIFAGGGTDSGAAGIGGQGAGLMALAESLINGDDAAKTFSNVSTSIATAAILQATGPIGQTIYVLDSILSKELGYDSPIQDAISYFADLTEKSAGWVIDGVSNIFGDVGDFVGDIGSFLGSIGIDLGGISLAEGGLVDLPSETSYNYADYYGGLSQMPQLSLDEVQPMAFAGGGLIPLVGGGKVARGPGGGLDDLIPTSIDGRRAAALSDGEFVIPADVVSMMGDGSSNAGAKRLYDMVRQVRQVKTGTSKQAGPLPVGKILERTMK